MSYGCHDDLVDPLGLACNKSSLTAQLATKQVFLYKYIQFIDNDNERKIHNHHPNSQQTHQHTRALTAKTKHVRQAHAHHGYSHVTTVGAQTNDIL